MTKPLTPLDQPTRRSVEALFKELLRYDYTQRESYQLSKQIQELKERLTDTPEVKALEEHQEAACQKENKERDKLETKVRKVRQKYLANGVTPVVIKALNELVDQANKE